MAQERYLSPKEILSYLCDLESKLPERKYKIYVESHRHDDDFGRVTPQEMNDECQRMLEFVGMGDYKADARFVTLDANTAGRTVPGYTPDRKISIEVSDNMTGNWKAVIATLAHEICHQVIHLHGIRPQHLDWMVETYTDLCTIYVGFGQLILDGYRTNVRRQERTLGYLDWNTYQVTNQMVNVVRGGVHSGNTGLQGSDVFADEVIQLWESEEKRNDVINKAFEKRSATLTDTMRNIAYMESLMNIYRERMKTQAKELSESFVATKDALRSGTDGSLKTFSALYDAHMLCQKNGEAEKDGVLEAALYNLYNNMQRRMGPIVLEREVVCPCCGKHYKLHGNTDSKKIIMCKQCGTNFVIDTSAWNPQAIQHREEQKRIEKKKRQDAELDALRIQVSGEEKAAAWKESEQLKQDLATIHDGIDSLPRMLRWMLKKYIYRQSSNPQKNIYKMKKFSIISFALYMLCSLNVNAAEAACFWKSKTPWQKMTTVLYAHGVDTSGIGVTTLVPADVLNESASDLAKTLGVKYDLVQSYSGEKMIGDVLCQYIQLKYTEQNEKHMYYRTRYSTNEDDYAKFIIAYPDSRYADEMQWKMNCMKAYWSWFEAMTEDACRLAYHYSNIVDNNVYEGFAPEYRDIVQYIQTVEDWEQLMLARAADGYSDCDAFTQFSRDHTGHLTGYNFFINDSIHNCEHNNAWSEARAANTIDGYRIYVIRFPEGEYAAWAKRFIADHEDWLDAREADNHAAYAAYCEKHPLGDSVDLAKERMRSIEESDWQRVKDSKNWVDIQAFLDRYPEGYYSDSAAVAIKDLFATPEIDMNEIFGTFGVCSITDTGVVCVSNSSLFPSTMRFTFTRRGRTVLQKTLQSGESYQFKIKNGTYHVVIDNPGNIHFKGLSDPYATHGDMTVTSKVYRFDYYSYPVNSTTKSLDNSTLYRIYGDRKAEKRALAAMYSYLEKNKITVWMNEYVCIKDRNFIWYTNGYNTNQYKDVFLTGDALKENKKVFADAYREKLDGFGALNFPLRVVMFNSATQTNDVFEYSAAELKQLKTKKIKK